MKRLRLIFMFSLQPKLIVPNHKPDTHDNLDNANW